MTETRAITIFFAALGRIDREPDCEDAEEPGISLSDVGHAMNLWMQIVWDILERQQRVEVESKTSNLS